jgi:hypothetical protein
MNPSADAWPGDRPNRLIFQMNSFTNETNATAKAAPNAFLLTI